jgi:squalene-associated FAD-dependent desaturase
MAAPAWPRLPEPPGPAAPSGSAAPPEQAAPAGRRPRLAVVGGGLAGLSAALLAADAGAEVVLVEAKPRLGGLTASFSRGGMWVDTGQHVFLRCCTAYRSLLDRLGVTHLTTLQDRLDVPVLLGGTGRLARLRRTRVRLPAPLHLTPALLGYRALPVGQRLRAALAAFQLGRLDPTRPDVDGTSFGDWLSRHGQGAAATEALWELLTVATINAPAAEASLGLAAKVVSTGLLEHAEAGDIGWPAVPLQRLHGDAASAALAAAGATVRTNTRARTLRRVQDGWEVAVEASGAGRVGDAASASAAAGGDAPDAAGGDGGWGAGRLLRADAVVLAVPPPAADALLPAGAVERPAPFAELGASPIVNIHLVYDRRVLDAEMLAAAGSPVQWIFDRTVSSGLAESRPGVQYLALSQSAAGRWVETPAAELTETFAAEMRRLLPGARDAELVEAFVTRERTATFRQAPGSLALRPGPATALPGLALAGAWTDTGWPATMEGAVRSGLVAVRVALDGLRRRAAASTAAASTAAGSPVAAGSSGPAGRPHARSTRPSHHPSTSGELSA